MLSKLENFLVFLLLLLLPSQLGYHWWPSWSLVSGVRVDYLSPTLYLTDILVMLLLAVAVVNKRLVIPKWLFIILGISLINIYFSQVPQLATYYWLRFWELLLLGLFLRTSNKLIIATGLVAGLIWTSILGLWQFSAQSSINGWWGWLGERRFNLSTPGIAKVVLPSGQYLLRAYATLPHPNALAGFLILGTALVYYCSPVLFRKINYLWALIFLALLTTWSRSGLVAGLGLIWWHLKNPVLKMCALALMVGAVFLPANPTSLSERLQLMRVAIHIFASHPWWGVGLGNFIPTAQFGFQPVHNIFLLLLTELGAIFFVLILGILIMMITKSDRQLRTIFLAIIALGLIDHYWLTLHQTQLLLTIFLAQVSLKSRVNGKTLY